MLASSAWRSAVPPPQGRLDGAGGKGLQHQGSASGQSILASHSPVVISANPIGLPLCWSLAGTGTQRGASLDSYDKGL